MTKTVSNTDICFMRTKALFINFYIFRFVTMSLTRSVKHVFYYNFLEVPELANTDLNTALQVYVIYICFINLELIL